MAALVRTLRVGPSTATFSGTARIGRRRATLSILVEVWGAGGERETLEADAIAAIAKAVSDAGGSTTARIRKGLNAAHDLLADACSGRPDLAVLGAGASVLVVDDEAILAQAGPALAYRAAAPGVERSPLESPWLASDITSLADHASWPPLGLGSELVVHWSHWPADPDTSLLIVPSTAWSRLSAGRAEGLLAESPATMKRALVAALGERTQAVHVVLTPEPSSEGGPGIPPVGGVRYPEDEGAEPEEGEEGAQGEAASDDMVSTTVGDTSSWEHIEDTQPMPVLTREREARPGGLQEPDPASTPRVEGPSVGEESPRAGAPPSGLGPSGAVRLVAVRVSRSGARVLRSMLPERTGPNAYRRERLRLVAIACVALPPLVIGLALAVRAIAGAPR